MAIHAVSAEEAIAQGSSCLQISSIIVFHENQITQKMKASQKSIANLPDWKARRRKQELESELQTHRQYIAHFTRVVERMRKLLADAH